MAECHVENCGRPVDDAAVCSHCGERLAQALGEVPALQVELDIALRKAARFGEANGSRTTTRPLPLDLAVSAVASDLRAILVSWTLLVAEERGLSLPADTVPAISRWLLNHVEWLRHHAAAQDAHEEILTAVKRVWRVVDRPQERIYVGPCNQCERDLYVKLGASVAYCRDCELDYDVAGRREWLRTAVSDQLACAVDASRALTTLGSPVTPERIYRWRRDGRVANHGHDEQRRWMFKIGDLVDLIIADATRRSA